MSPLGRYQQALANAQLQPDAEQAKAVEALDALFEDLCTTPQNGGLFGKLIRLGRGASQAPVRGLYLWGGVGRGKTHLMDWFYAALPFDAKRRLHFHRFMEWVHAELAGMEDELEPLEVIAANFAADARVLCLDEFQVTDITDAMLLAGLLKGLFSRGVTLVTTSNVEPNELYQDGLQRARFLPAIELLKQHTQVIHLGGDTDYRLRALVQGQIYHYPLNTDAKESLAETFSSLLIAAQPYRNRFITINERKIPVIRWAEGIVWFEFEVLCNTPRSRFDYTAIARLFNTVLISGISELDDKRADVVRRLINLIDEFYDRNIKLIVSAAALPHKLYTGKRLKFEFERTVSRLIEMQSQEYLAKKHLV